MTGMHWLIVVGPIAIVLGVAVMAFGPVIGRRLPPRKQAKDELRGPVSGGVKAGDEHDPQRDEIPHDE